MLKILHFLAEWFSENAGRPGPGLFFIFLLSCTKGDLFMTLTGEAGFVLGIPLQLDRNRFESPSLPDSENLTEQWQHRSTNGNLMVMIRLNLF